MNFRLLGEISRSLLFARWRQTLVAAIGVTFSIAMFIALLGFMNGLNDLLDGLILNRTPHVRIFNEIRPNDIQPVQMAPGYGNQYHFIRSVKTTSSRQELYNSGGIIKTVQKDNRVLGITSRVNAPIFFNDGNVDLGAVINGIDPQNEIRLFKFNDYIVKGSAQDLNYISNSIILGKALAEKLFADIGDVVQLTSSRGERFSLRVVGFFQTGIQDIDKVQSFASIPTTQKILGKPNNYINEIYVKLHDIEQAPAVAKEYAGLFGTDTEDVQTANAQFETGSYVRTIISYAVGIVLLIVAGFGIYNILNMMIYEKMDSIAILKATGFSGGDVKRIFLFIAMSIGIFGGLTGLFLGFVLSTIIDSIPFDTAALPTIKTYPVNYDLIYYVIGGIFSLVTTYLAGWLPARKASKVDPVVIIRGK